MTNDPDFQASESSESQNSYEELYRGTYRATLAYALRRTTTQADAHDVVAETYLVAWRRRDEFLEARQPQAWLYGVARRVLSNQRRTRSRQAALLERAITLDQYFQIQPSHSAETYEEVVAVERAMSALSERDQEILRLVGYEELDHDEIATAMDISRSLVRSVLFRARRRLNKALDHQVRLQVGSGHSLGDKDTTVEQPPQVAP